MGSYLGGEVYGITGSRDSIIFGLEGGNYSPVAVNSITGSAVIAAGYKSKVGLGFGYSGNTEYSAMIAASGEMAGGMLNSGMYATNNSNIYGSGNQGVGMVIVGGGNNTINRGNNGGIFGSYSSNIPNAFVDYCGIYGVYAGTVNGGSSNTLFGGIQNTISAGSYNSIFGGSSQTISGGGNTGGIFGGYNNQITAGDLNYIVASKECAMSATGFHNKSIVGSANASLTSVGSFGAIIGARGGTLSGGDTMFIIGGQGHTVGSGYGDAYLGGRENSASGRSTGGLGHNVNVGGYNNVLGGSSTSTGAILGGKANKLGSSSTSVTEAAVIAGDNNQVLHNRSVVIAGSGSLSTADDQVVVPQLLITGSATGVEAVMTMKPCSTLPAAASYPNSFAVSGSKPYFSDGSSWTALF